MPTPLITRQDQFQTMGFTPPTTALVDALLDGIFIPRGVKAKDWIPEPTIHQAVKLSSFVDTTRNLLGPQTSIVRDEVRQKTWVAFIEQGGKLLLAEIYQGVVTTSVLAGANVWRSHIVLDKYSGNIRAVWIQRSGSTTTLWLDGVQISTAAVNADFPYMGLSQAPIGHMQTQAPTFGLITYKDRNNGRSYYRTFSGTTVNTEQTLTNTAILGGPSFTISGTNVYLRIDALVSGAVEPRIAISTNSGQTFSAFAAVTLPYGSGYTVLRSPQPVTDYEGFFHAPLSFTDGSRTLAVNLVVDEAFVEAIDVPQAPAPRDRIVLAAFPKKDATINAIPQRFGDEVTDGLGLIMVTQSRGRLYTSNSQAGGKLFPEPEHLNHEMPYVAAFDATECYTRGVTPNTVSMDYAYIELDPATGLPASRDLYLETWDMPLPIPVATATASGMNVTVVITKDANFFAGDTTFNIVEPGVGITNVTITDERNATVTTNSSALVGKHIRFVVSNVFYYHEGIALIQ